MADGVGEPLGGLGALAVGLWAPKAMPVRAKRVTTTAITADSFRRIFAFPNESTCYTVQSPDSTSSSQQLRIKPARSSISNLPPRSAAGCWYAATRPTGVTPTPTRRRSPIADPDTPGDLVLVHSTTQGPAGFDPLVAALARRGHRAFAPQLHSRPTVTAAEHADQLAPTCIGPAVLAHSAAGLCCRRAAAVGY